jgi:virginiamycin B lyase
MMGVAHPAQSMPLASYAASLLGLVVAGALLAQCAPPASETKTGEAAAETLMEGAGRARVEALCTSCHRPRIITASSGYTRAHWDELIATMVELNPEDEGAVLDYLAEHYPPSHNPRPAHIVEGPLQISFREWTTQKLGQRARDPVEAPDGMIWYVGQQGNVIGRMNPTNGDVREWPLPEGALPHSVTIDADGGVWYTGNGNGTIGKFDPEIGQAREYRMPDPNARDPHTAEFDRNGIMWFTLQQSNMIGRFDPRSDAIRLVSVQREGARPYGIKIAADGTLWVACNGGNCIIRVDPRTMALTEIALPGEETTVRRLDIASDGRIWYVNSGRGRLGVYNPANGAIREWPSPSGPDSHPYAIAVINDIVWYNESGVRPDALVRFDPRTETFQSWPIPSGSLYAGMVRHMRATRDGNLLLHQGSTNRIILASLPPAT